MPVQSAPTSTLKQVADRTRLNEKLNPQVRAEDVSAINTFAKVCGCEPWAILADPGAIRALKEKAAWQLAGLQKGSWANVLTRLTRALARDGVAIHRRRRNLKLSPEWEALLAPLLKRDRDELHRFAGWSSVLSISPSQISSEEFNNYLQYLETQSHLSKPRERYHVARRAWNRAIAVPGSDYPQVPSNEPPGWRGLRFEDFPSTLASELDAYRAYLLNNDPFADTKPRDPFDAGRAPRPVAKVTADNYLASLRQSASRLIDGGAPVTQFGSLSAFVELSTVKAGLRCLLRGRPVDEHSTPGLHALMTATLSLAEYLKVDYEHLESLKSLARKVRHVRPKQGSFDAVQRRRSASPHDAAALGGREAARKHQNAHGPAGAADAVRGPVGTAGSRSHAHQERLVLGQRKAHSAPPRWQPRTLANSYPEGRSQERGGNRRYVKRRSDPALFALHFGLPAGA